MCYRGGRGVVPTDESTSIRNSGDAYFPMHMCIGDAIFYYMRSYRRWPPMNSRMMDVGGIAVISSGDRATM